MQGKWESSLTLRAVLGGKGAAEKFYAPPAMAGQLLGMESHVLMQGGATPEGGEEGGWAHVPAFDRTNPKDVDFKNLRAAGEDRVRWVGLPLLMC